MFPLLLAHHPNQTLTRGEWGGGTPPTRLNSTPAGKIPPPNRKKEKVKGEKFANSLRNPRK